MMRKLYKKLPKMMGIAKKYSNVAAMTLVLLFLFSGSALASPPKIVSGSVNLFKDITKWLLLIIPVGAGAFITYQYVQKGMTEDDAIISQKNKYIKNAFMSAAVGIGADALVLLVLTYYA